MGIRQANLYNPDVPKSQSPSLRQLLNGNIYCAVQVDFGTWGTSGLSKNVFTAEQGVSYYVVLESEDPFPDCDGASVEVVPTTTGIHLRFLCICDLVCLITSEITS